MRVWRGGEGPPLLWLHGFEQHPGDAPYLQRVARARAVTAPEHPGFGDSRGFEKLTDIQDLALYYREVLASLGPGPVDVVGHCLGGMIAAELAILAPDRVGRLVLIAPYGLWRDETPLPDPFVLPPPRLAAAKWADPAWADRETSAYDPAAGDSPAEFRTINLTAASKFLWPLPDRGLARRLPYLHTPTLVIHGETDGLVSASYDAAWAAASPRIRTARIAGAGHLPMVEAEDALFALIDPFLGAAP